MGPTISPTPTPPEPHRVKSGSARRVVARVVVVLLVALVCLVIFLAMRKGNAPDSPEKRLPSTLRTWRKSRTLPVPQGQASAYSLAFSPDGRLLAAAFGNNEDSGPKQSGRVCVWEVDGGRNTLDKEVESGPATCVAFSPDGKRLAWGAGSWNHGTPGHVTLWDLAEKSAKRDFEAHRKGVLNLAFQPGGNLLVTSGLEGKVLMWDGRWGTAQGELKDYRAPVVALAFSPDGKQLASGCDDGSADLWEVQTPKEIAPLVGSTGKPVRGLAFSKNGETILAVTKRGQGSTADLLTWKGPDRKLQPVVPIGETEAYCLAISPDRTTFLVGCLNKTAKLYQTATRQELQTLSGDRAFLCLAFSPDGRYLATSGGWFGPVQLWEAEEDPSLR